MGTTEEGASAEDWGETMERSLRDLRIAGEERRRRRTWLALVCGVAAGLLLAIVAIAGGAVHWSQWLMLVVLVGGSALNLYGPRLSQRQGKALSGVFFILAIVVLAGVVSMFGDILSDIY